MFGDKLTTVHDNVEIEYYRRDNKWHFTFEGRDYTGVSLEWCEGKIEEIHKAIALKKRKMFEPIPVFHGLNHGRITSLTEESGHDWVNGKDAMVPYVRFVNDGDKAASKIQINALFVDTESNRWIVQRVKDLRKEADDLYATLTRMKPADLPTFELEETQNG